MRDLYGRNSSPGRGRTILVVRVSSTRKTDRDPMRCTIKTRTVGVTTLKEEPEKGGGLGRSEFSTQSREDTSAGTTV